MLMNPLAFVLSFIALAGISCAAESGVVMPHALRCEYRRDPMGIDAAAPRLNWLLKAAAPDARSVRQSAYQVLIASSPTTLARDEGDLWDSGKVASGQSAHVAYAGSPLHTSQQAFWKVRVWDQQDHASTWSDVAQWTMGVLRPEDWQAKWISAEGADALSDVRGYHAREARQVDEVKWVQVDLGKPVAMSTIRLHPMRHAGKDGFAFPVRFKVEAASDAAFSQPQIIADHTAADYANPGLSEVCLDGKSVSARYVRVTVTKLWKRDWAYCFALRELEVVSNGKNVAKGAAATALDSHEGNGWGITALTDGVVGTEETVAKYPTMLLRRAFEAKPGLKRAVVHVCGLGQYEMSINGRKVGEDLLSPGWTNYRKTCLYDTFDVTAMLREGENAVGIFLGNGMYHVAGPRYHKFRGSFGPPKAIAQLRLEYADGSSQIVGTDANWRVAPGPITLSCIFGGEDFDARLVQRGWDQAQFDDSAWQPAIITQSPGGELKGLSFAAPPVRAFDVLKPASIRQLAPGVAVYDLGQNTSLMPRIRVKGPAGSVVRITPAELLRQDGSVDRGSSGGGAAYWQYTLAGGDAQTWFPKFFYHGARYLQVECTALAGAALPEVESIEGVVVHSSAVPVGQFACSSDLFNRTRTLIRWAQRSNLVSVITDCPHRERLGWLEQYHLNGPSLRYEWDLATLYEKGMRDMADAQLDNGLVPDIAPEYTVFADGFRDSPEWGSAIILAAWQQYEFTGDAEVLRRYYGSMKRYVEYLRTKAMGHMLNHGLGDWYDLGPKPPGQAQLTPVMLTATATYYQDLITFAKIARLLGHVDEAASFDSLAGGVRNAFNRAMYKPDQQSYATGSQTANAMPLVVGLAEPADRTAVLDAIVRDIRARGNGLTAGDVGYHYLLRALADGGRSDVVFDMNTQIDKPGYGYILSRGATALTEAWDARPGSSHNHFMLGHIVEWFYHDLAGIQPDPAGPGFERIIIRPAIVGDISWAKASYDSIRGRITSEWEKQGRVVAYRIVIPVQTTATVHIRAASVDAITESGQPLARAQGVKVLGSENGTVSLSVESGEYRFAVQAE